MKLHPIVADKARCVHAWRWLTFRWTDTHLLLRCGRCERIVGQVPKQGPSTLEVYGDSLK